MLKKCDRDPEQFEEELPSRLLSAVCVIIAIVHFARSEWKADWILFAFIVLCFIPWLGYVFDSIGGENWGAKYRKNREGKTSAPSPGTTAASIPSAATSAETGIRMVQQPSSALNQFVYPEMKVGAS